MKVEYHSSDREAAANLLRTIRDDKTDRYSAGEKMRAVKDLAILTGDDLLAGQGPGSMTRAEIQAELARCGRLLGDLDAPTVRQPVRRRGAKSLANKASSVPSGG